MLTRNRAKIIGFILNPIAGMGGTVGLKGTDGVVARAIALGARPVAPRRAAEMLRGLHDLLESDPDRPRIRWLACAGPMGEDLLRRAALEPIEVLLTDLPLETTAETTGEAARLFDQAGADLILFCGGDGTARDIVRITGVRTPVLGIPAGVKMFSGVFGVTPARTARLVHRFARGEIGVAPADIVDLDEVRYRQGEFVLRLKAAATTPFEPTLTQVSKLLITSSTDAQVKDEIASTLRERIHAERGRLFLLGPGTTVKSVGDALGIDKSLLGIDAVLGGRQIGTDLNETALLALLERHPVCTLVLSPIGAQGFVLGRGNQPLSPAVVRRIGASNIVVIATPAKLAQTPALRFDTGDDELDRSLTSRKFLPVIVGYRRSRAVRVAAAG